MDEEVIQVLRKILNAAVAEGDSWQVGRLMITEAEFGYIEDLISELEKQADLRASHDPR